MIKTIIKVNEGISDSFTETMVMFNTEAEYNIEMQSFKTREQAREHLNRMINAIIKIKKVNWDLVLRCEDVKIKGKDVIELNVFESNENTCFLYMIEE